MCEIELLTNVMSREGGGIGQYIRVSSCTELTLPAQTLRMLQ